MSWLVDTSVVSELRKGARCHPRVAAWAHSVADDETWLSVLVIGEIRRGVEAVRARDAASARTLERWLHRLLVTHADRILAVDARVADEWGRIAAARPTPVVDGLLAATAIVHDLVLVTRNTKDVAGTGARVLDPFHER